MATITEQQQNLHIFFFPLMAHGHMLPMFDIARLFATHGAKSTFITTPPNAPLFSTKIDRDRSLGLDIQIQTIDFPHSQVGLPESFSSSKSITSPEMAEKFVKAFALFTNDLERLLQLHRPHCLVADMFFPWATDLASRFGIPRLVFHGTSLFYLCVDHSIRAHQPHRHVSSDAEPFVVPDVPDRIELTRGVLGDDPEEFWEEIRESEAKSLGILANTFYELEPNYVDHYKNKLGKKAWEIGPVSLCNRSVNDKLQRGENQHHHQYHRCLSWLDSQKPNSVLYISFGSESHFSRAQLGEIAMGLEASRVPFIWVVRTTSSSEVDTNADDFLPNGFRERNEGKGLVIIDWAPQVLILDHEAVGGFLTHCGWNSVMESVCAGVPMITWPLYAEQFYNEKFVNEVLRIGVRVGNEDWCSWTDEINTSVKRDKVERAVVGLMREEEEKKKWRG
ncbi:hypothetical protein Syun_004753 [Stephania yunnanensis]|uniref:Glycosyltransferase n=1 Tax=Stephania yunnanensis TaxID=152371 RepID=A0AAP0L3U7_9MAGN